MNLSWCPIIQVLMRSFCVVKHEVKIQSDIQSWYGTIVFDVDVFVLDRAPKTLNEDIVESTAAAIHANLDPNAFKCTSKGASRELNALITVEYIRPAKLQSLVQRI